MEQVGYPRSQGWSVAEATFRMEVEAGPVHVPRRVPDEASLEAHDCLLQTYNFPAG